MTDQDFKDIYDSIPTLPGVYRFMDEKDTILYVGKAKELRKRLSNYFGDKQSRYYKTRMMVKNASRIEFTIVETEHDALLLENTYIKKYQPKYNVSFKDGKTYSYICIKKERFPRVFFTRNPIQDGSMYFGPYTSKGKVRIILDMIKKLFPLRSCAYQLTEENISKGKFKVCLEYHIKNCKGACVGLETQEEYDLKIVQIKNMLRGNFSKVKHYIHEQMQIYAENLQFELAQQYKEKLLLLEDYQAKSTVVSTTERNIDVFAIRTDKKNAFIQFLHIVDGALVYSSTHEMEINLNDDEVDLLSLGVSYLREKYQSESDEIILPYAVPVIADAELTVPQRGEKQKLLELAHKNLDYYLAQKKKKELERKNKKGATERILNTLRSDLHMDELPVHIECLDNSNLQGTNPTASCVVFKNAKPSKEDYRHFKIKTVEGPDDFASMKEIVYRRYKRLLEENSPLPQLIIIDGGKGQLNAAVQSLIKLEIISKVTVVGIAKRLEEIYFPGDPIPVYINKKSESLKLIQYCRNEAHRFAISFHRDLRSKNFVKTELTEIQGIGEKTAVKLLKEFGSVKNIREKTPEEIAKTVGISNAKKIFTFFGNQKITE
jgi:excinuclease ABC subunit C